MTIKQKVGASLLWECEYIDDAGSPVNLTGYTIEINAKNSANVTLFSLTSGVDPEITKHATTGKYQVLIKDTTSWIPDDYRVDIDYKASDNIVKSSETFTLKVLSDV